MRHQKKMKLRAGQSARRCRGDQIGGEEEDDLHSIQRREKLCDRPGSIRQRQPEGGGNIFVNGKGGTGPPMGRGAFKVEQGGSPHSHKVKRERSSGTWKATTIGGGEFSR